MYTGILKIIISVVLKKFIHEYLLYVTLSFFNNVFMWTLSYYCKHSSFLFDTTFSYFSIYIFLM